MNPDLFSPQTLALGLAWYLVFVISTTLHEAAHAWAALRLGDRTAYEGGQVTLNPLPHMEREPVGMIVVPILSFLVGGWMIGWASAPFDVRWALRHPRRAALMALAGPAANLSLLIVAGLLLRAGLGFGAFSLPDAIRIDQIVFAEPGNLWHGAARMLSILFMLNLLLGVFNLIPLPPLDGSSLVPLFSRSHEWSARYFYFCRTPAAQMLGLMAAWGLMRRILPWAQVSALNLLYSGRAEFF